VDFLTQVESESMKHATFMSSNYVNMAEIMRNYFTA